MSVQACRIKGYGHILKNEELPPRFNKIEKDEYIEKFWRNSKLEKDYWFFADKAEKKEKKTENEIIIGACFNYIDGNEYFIGIITEATYLECSNENWDRVKFRNDEYIKKYKDKS
jgi:hypothetical protein